jgi:hydrogenase maturation protease
VTTGEAHCAPPATLVIGLGNPLRADDGVGVRAIELLAAQTLPPDVEVADGGTQGLGIVNLMEGRRRVILVDAAHVGKAPGQFSRFALHETHLLDDADLSGDDSGLNTKGTKDLSIHAAGLREALLLAHALKMLPDNVIIFGVQPNSLEWETGLSPEVEEGLPDLVAAMLAEVSEGVHQHGAPSAES